MFSAEKSMKQVNGFKIVFEELTTMDAVEWAEAKPWSISLAQVRQSFEQQEIIIAGFVCLFSHFRSSHIIAGKRSKEENNPLWQMCFFKKWYS